ncbi:hypothetical protein MLD38_039319 [Melastoma candidum]|uniref:Uncharacterized protein n=1 Tax=Melastoma candidum TaxID=119954 RepID=A0ACB9L2S0_9MYRT|nr:hypothetical protein MLD38_039319 [Melastoma candidum]
MSGNVVIEFEEGWEIVKKGLTKLENLLEWTPELPFTGEDYMMIYTTIYSMCTQKPPHHYSQKIYDKYKEVIEEYLAMKVFPSLASTYGDFLLRDFVIRWRNHKVMVRWFSCLFSYLNRYFISRRSLPNLNEVGFGCFQTLVYQPMKDNIREAVIVLIDRERDGEQTDNTLIKHVVDIFIEIGGESMAFYVNDFEVYLLQDTGVYYARKASSWVLDNSRPIEDICEGYLSKAEECWKREKERILPYVHSSSDQKLLEKIHQEIYVPYKNQLLEQELTQFLSLLRNNMVDEISRIYKNRKVTCLLEPVAKIFKEHAAAEGTSLLKQAEDARGQATAATVGQLHQVLVTNLIELHDRYMVYVTYCFSGHFLFQKALDDAFRTFLDRGLSNTSTGELLVNFCDNIFKRGGIGKLSDEATEETIGKIVELVAYISDQGLFIEFYWRRLAQRLLSQQSSMDDHERFMLSKLKHRFGASFTSKLEGMVVDLELSKEMATEFKDHISNHPSADLRMDLSVSVLTTGYWPSIRSTNLNLPEEMEKPLRIFEDFFRSRRQHRRLSWMFSFGICILTGRFDTKAIELVLSTYQAAVLLLFNDADRLSYSEILAQQQLPEVDLVRVLQSLSCGKYKILNKDPSSSPRGRR